MTNAEGTPGQPPYEAFPPHVSPANADCSDPRLMGPELLVDGVPLDFKLVTEYFGMRVNPREYKGLGPRRHNLGTTRRETG